MLGPTLLRAARSDRLRAAVVANPLSRRVVTRFVAGEETSSALAAVADLHRQGVATSLDFLGEDVHDLAGARLVRDRYLTTLEQLAGHGEAERSEVSVKLSALGQAIPGDGPFSAHDLAHEICAAATAVGCRVTLDMEDHTTADSTLTIAHELRKEFPATGTVLQANLRRTAGDLAALADSGARIRLVKGAYREPPAVAFQRKSEVDRAYLDGLRTLMSSSCRPMAATHDPAMLKAAVSLAASSGRSAEDWEAQLLYGIADRLQHELVKAGHQVRVYVPFGCDWYGYFMRRLAERPANVAFFLRALAHR